MHCEHCAYSLWGIRARTCPACGTPFLPSEWEYEPFGVRFCCPHCGKHYYGTGVNGHIEPPVFDCVACGRRIHMDEMVLMPDEDAYEDEDQDESGGGGVPWLQRGGRNRFRAWLDTAWMAVAEPDRLMRLTPIEGSLGAALRFMAFSYAFLVCALAIFSMVVRWANPEEPLEGSFTEVALGLVIVAAYLLTWGVAIHVVLRLTGRTAGGLGRTIQAVCYSSGLWALLIVPCIGVLIGLVGIFVSSVRLISHGQRVHWIRAVLAILALPLVLLAWALTRLPS